MKQHRLSPEQIVIKLRQAEVSFYGKLRDELLNGEIFFTVREATILIERWRVHSKIEMNHQIRATPIFANGTLFVMTESWLHAIRSAR
jgi:hypothetical protein